MMLKTLSALVAVTATTLAMATPLHRYHRMTVQLAEGTPGPIAVSISHDGKTVARFPWVFNSESIPVRTGDAITITDQNVATACTDHTTGSTTLTANDTVLYVARQAVHKYDNCTYQS